MKANISLLISYLREIKIPGYLKFILPLLVVTVVFISVQSYRGDKKALHFLNESYASADSIINLAAKSDELFAVLKQKGFYESSLSLAENDSIGLSINMTDSTVSLMLKGVELQTSKITSYSYSRIFNKMNRGALINLLSHPQKITLDTSNIAKEPIKIMKAPKDEEEAALMLSQIEPDTVREFVAMKLQLNDIIHVMIEEEPDSVPQDAYAYFNFLASIDSENTRKLWVNLITFETPEYQPWIKIYLKPNEVKSIFRALPQSGNVVLRFN